METRKTTQEGNTRTKFAGHFANVHNEIDNAINDKTKIICR